MASLSVAGNQDKTDQDPTDIGEENLNRNQLKNPTFTKKRRCVPRNGRCATDLDCCDGIPCHGLNGNNRCVTDREFGKSIINGFIIAVVFLVGCSLLGILLGLCRIALCRQRVNTL